MTGAEDRDSERLAVVRMDRVTRRFGKRFGLTDVSLEIPAGAVYGLLGLNGSGKSTLLKLLMGHLRPDMGAVELLGRGYEEAGQVLRERVGYISEDRNLYDWMTVGEAIRFAKAFRLTWDGDKAASLQERFELPTQIRVRELSRGMRARLSLLVTLAWHPDVLLLDEPTSGLDPQVRRTFLEEILAELGELETTVILSTHLVDEIELIGEYVGILHEGRLVVSETVDELRTSVCQVRFPADGPTRDLRDFPGFLRMDTLHRERVITLRYYDDYTLAHLEEHGIVGGRAVPMSLENIFLTLIDAHPAGGENHDA